MIIPTLLAAATLRARQPNLIGRAFPIAGIMVIVLISVFARLSGLACVNCVFMVPATARLNSTTLTPIGEMGKQRVIDNVVGGSRERRPRDVGAVW